MSVTGRRGERCPPPSKNRGYGVSASSRVLLFLESEERSSLWFVLLLRPRWQGLALGSLLVRLGLRVDPVHPQLHLLLVGGLEQVEATVCKSQPEDIFLLCVVGGRFSGAVHQVDGGLALEGVPGMGPVGLLVFVEEYLVLLQHHANLLPRPVRGFLGCALPLVLPHQHSLQFPIARFDGPVIVLLVVGVVAAAGLLLLLLLLEPEAAERRLRPRRALRSLLLRGVARPAGCRLADAACV